LDLIATRFQIDPDFWGKVYSWIQSFPFSCILDGNGHEIPFGSAFGKIAAVGSTELKWTQHQFFSTFSQSQKAKNVFGFLSYELKNEIENLTSGNQNTLGFPDAIFFQPEVVIEELNGAIEITAVAPGDIFEQILKCSVFQPKDLKSVVFSKILEKETYWESIEKIKELISSGLVYELNYCQFFETSKAFCGLSAFVELKKNLPMPFSAWFKANEFEIASASPERFLKKTGSKLLAQPMKGTAKRGENGVEDRLQIKALFESEKERAENLMIVDLVRNDLAKVSETGTTKVEELFGIYPFPTVFQMVSTVSAQLDPEKTWLDAIQASFPMGSMTGAPKIEVMQQIEKLENRNRGAFAGALGYVLANEDFDFNVLIRSLFINHKKNKAGFAVGSAITIDSNPEDEWTECQNKVEGMLTLFGSSWEEIQS